MGCGESSVVCTAGLRFILKHPHRSAHRRVTWAFCTTYRQDLDSFIAEAHIHQLSFGFRRMVAAMMFIPVVERDIEAKHALVQMALCDSGLKGSTVKISFANRLPEVRLRLERNPSMLEDLLRCFSESTKAPGGTWITRIGGSSPFHAVAQTSSH